MPRRPLAADRPPSPEGAEALIGFVNECLAAAASRRALLLQLSHLPPEIAPPERGQVARAALAPLLDADRALAFSLPSGDFVVVWRGDAETLLERSLERLAALFAEGAGLRVLCRLFELPADAAALLDAAEASLVADARRAELPDTRDPLDPVALASLEQALAHADMSRFVRRRPICALGPDGFRLRWERRSLALGELLSVLAPGRSARAAPWLLRRLTRTLDRRMLALLAAPGELLGARPFSVQLNVTSILGPEFLRFDAALPSTLRGKVTLELLATDVLADLAAFAFARDFARSRGYALALRGIGRELLGVLPPARLGVAWVHLRWSPSLLTLDLEAEGHDPAQLVLSRADCQQAVAWGRVQGITLFAGRAVRPRGANRAIGARRGVAAGAG
jgi:hypothetical protein